MRKLVRRSDSLVLYWEDGKLVCEDYISHKKAAISQGVIGVLDALSKGGGNGIAARTGAEGGTQQRGSADTSFILRQLKRLGFVHSRRNGDGRLDSWTWGKAARHFLFSTKDAHIPQPRPKRLSYARSLLRASKQPPLYKTYPKAKAAVLPRPAASLSPLAFQLANLRSVRAFSRAPISAAELGQVLFLVWGEQRKINTKPWGRLIEKTSYSAGYRNPIEVYTVVRRVRGLRPGLYHYNVKDHSLELLKRGNFERVVNRVANRQEWARGAAAYFLMTAVLERTMFKYRHDHALRTIFCDLGALSQTLHIAASALSLGASVTYALNHSLGERFLGVDGRNEPFLGLGLLGRPFPSSRHQ